MEIIIRIEAACVLVIFSFSLPLECSILSHSMVILSLISMILSNLMAYSMEGVVLESTGIFQIIVLVVPFIFSRGGCGVIIKISRIERTVVEDIDAVSVCLSV